MCPNAINICQNYKCNRFCVASFSSRYLINFIFSFCHGLCAAASHPINSNVFIVSSILRFASSPKKAKWDFITLSVARQSLFYHFSFYFVRLFWLRNVVKNKEKQTCKKSKTGAKKKMNSRISIEKKQKLQKNNNNNDTFILSAFRNRPFFVIFGIYSYYCYWFICSSRLGTHFSPYMCYDLFLVC